MKSKKFFDLFFEKIKKASNCQLSSYRTRFTHQKPTPFYD
ncbi:hypothetical protein SORDD05_00895 [Streptococcus oralis]|uniref:Uncharacterized protein n=1 Tax=Streptococcus oralis TaxID=1303 RepID=A0A139M9Q5_STROR|nr:hypothetical protein SORDD05_00895 [Streptococcus oralis]